MESFRSKLCPQPSTLAAIFVLALAIRWTYDIVTYLTMGLPGLLGADSYAYVQVAQTFAGQIEAHAVSNWQWLGPNPSFMPLFTWLLTLCALVFGTAAPLAYTLIQGLCDAATCCVVYNIAQTIDRRIAIYAAVAAAINPTQVVVAGLVYPDTPFVFFVSLFLCGSLRWIQLPTWRSTLLIGVGLVGAAQIRILVAPWGPALLLFLIAVPVIRRQLRAPYVAQLGLAGLILAVGLAGISLRNLTQYGSASLTPQGGTHLNWWVVPLVQEAKDGTPWAVTMQAMQDRTRARFGADSRNPFIQSERNTQVATDELKMLGAAAIIKAWLYGAVLNLG
jgi:4-amino-4-deoxy-L-arabinose transferase-like glycosyltransferase